HSLLLYLFLLLPLPPCSTLFPYTTLFRSLYLFLHLLPFLKIFWGSHYLYTFLEIIFYLFLFLLHKTFLDTFSKNKTLEYLLLDKDRKSTRLNSSHVSISYAVFCLKKK